MQNYPIFDLRIQVRLNLAMSSNLEFTVYGHASVLLSCGEFSILTDPWFKNTQGTEPFFAVPAVKEPTPSEIEKISALHISHNHPDHFSPESLALFRLDIPIFITKYRDQVFFNQISALGFTNIIEIPPGIEGTTFGPFQLYQLPLPGSYAYDSALTVRVNSEFYFLNNDCIFSSRAYSFLKAAFGKFKGCFLGYSPFSVYPIAYDYDSCQNLKLTHPNKNILEDYKKYYWDQFSMACQILEPDWVVPYACGIRFAKEDMLLYNKMFNEPYGALNQDLGKTKAVIMWPQDKMDSEGKLEFNSLLRTQPQVPSPPLPPLVTNFLSEAFVLEKKELFGSGFLSLLRQEAKNWNSAMKIKFSIATKENPLDFDFIFNGKDVVPADFTTDNYDIKVNYPSGLLFNIFSGSAHFERVHYSYSKHFSVKIIKLIYGQQEVHAWGRGWKL